MTAPTPAMRFTPDDLLKLEKGGPLYEIIDGKRVEKNMSSVASENWQRLNRSA